MKKQMNLGGLLGQAQKMATGENTQKNGDPTEDAIKAAKLKIQMLQDFKNLGKKGFAEKYAGITDEQKKIIGYGKGYTIQEITEDFKGASKDWGDEKTISASIPDLEKKYEAEKIVKGKKLEEEALQKTKQDAEKLKQDQEFNTYKTDIDNLNKLKGDVKTKYKYDMSQQPVNTMEAYRKGFISEAEERIKNRKDVKVPGQPNNEMTCISGVCTLAANQGVDFSKMAGAGQGLRDEKGRIIPAQNKAFLDNLDKTGYEEIPIDQIQPSDLVQYDSDEGRPVHMEAYLGKEYDPSRKVTANRLFNNYDLTNAEEGDDRIGESFRIFNPDGSDTNLDKEVLHKKHRAFRIKQETADAAYAKLHPEYAEQLAGKKNFESSEDFKNYTALNDKIEALKTSNPDLYKRLTTTATETTTNAKK